MNLFNPQQLCEEYISFLFPDEADVQVTWEEVVEAGI
jgi:hypothetical protein